MNELTLDSLKQTVKLLDEVAKLPSAVKVHPSMHKLMLKKYRGLTTNPPHPAHVPQTFLGLTVWPGEDVQPDEVIFGDIVRGEFVPAKQNEGRRG